MFLAARIELKYQVLKDFSREAKDEAPLSANCEAISASLKGKAVHSKDKHAFKGRAKTIDEDEATL